MIRDEAPADHDAVADVVRRAFGRDDEAQLVGRLRDEGVVRASLVEVAGDAVIGHVMFSTIVVAGERDDAVALAPLAVRPDRQRAGVGAALVEAGIARCRALGVSTAFVLGDPAFYGRFGFSASAAAPFSAPWSGPHFMALALRDDGARGALRYPRAFGAFASYADP